MIRKKGVIGGKGARERAKIVLGGREGRIGGTMSVRRKVFVESIARSKTKMGLRAPGDARAGVMEAKVSGFMGRQGGKASIRRKPRKKPAPSLEVMKDSPPRRVGVRREQAKIEPAGLSAAISAIVNNIMSMIFGER